MQPSLDINCSLLLKQETNMESTAGKCEEKGLQGILNCKDKFTKTWGLKTGMLYWILSMVIRPFLTCGSMVWWPRFRYFSRTHLLKIQTLTCMTIKGVIRSTSTAAMEVHLGLSPLHVIVGVKAQQGVYRLTGKHQSNPISTNYVHIKSPGT